MPLIKFFGIPTGRDEQFYLNFKESIREDVIAIKEMELSSMKDVSVKLMSEIGGDDGEIQIEVTFNKYEAKRTFEVKKKLADAITARTDKVFPKLTLIESWGNPFDPDERGFSCIRH